LIHQKDKSASELRNRLLTSADFPKKRPFNKITFVWSVQEKTFHPKMTSQVKSYQLQKKWLGLVKNRLGKPPTLKKFQKTLGFKKIKLPRLG
jgi:hypothetical protein